MEAAPTESPSPDGASSRWAILALLFSIRTVMALQFQSVATLAPMMRDSFGFTVGDIGFLIGLYLAPGVALALPGGGVGRRFGDKPVVAAGLALMTCGGLVMALSAAWEAQVAGRLLAGIGGVLLNVLMAKMVSDWFVGREIATAMAIFVNSWPLGIAIALVALPHVAAATSVGGVFALTAALSFAGLVALALLYRPPPAAPAAPTANAAPTGSILYAVIAAGLIWGLYNAALSMVFGFGPSMLTERGWSVAQASGAISVVLWLTVVSVPLGGLAADRLKRQDAFMIAGFIAPAVLLALASRVEALLPLFLLLGLIGGVSAGSVMSLPAKVLAPPTRAVGMGVFYAVFYLVLVAAPWIAGALADMAGSAAIAFDLGAAMLIACWLCLALFRRLAEPARSFGRA